MNWAKTFLSSTNLKVVYTRLPFWNKENVYHAIEIYYVVTDKSHIQAFWAPMNCVITDFTKE